MFSLWIRSIFLLIFIAATEAVHGQVNHKPKWTGTQLSYGLTDLDQFESDDFDYCRWGVLLGESSVGSVEFRFNELTKEPYDGDLFLTRVESGSRVRRTYENRPFPLIHDRVGPNGSGISILRFQNSDPELSLYRYLHFKNDLIDEVEALNKPIPTSTRKLVILIHGWNSDSKKDSYDTTAWKSLRDELRAILQDDPDWKLVCYRWEPDADTGPRLLPDPIAAATISHLHGQHLGELLYQNYPYLEKIQLIAHSAGTWAARAAARFILEKQPNCSVQITLLDPFIPEVVALSYKTVLNSSIIAGIPSLSGSSQLKRLENYFSDDLTFGTNEEFSWGSGPGLLNQQISWLLYYFGHSAPIQFYADTVKATLKNEEKAPGLYKFDIEPESSARIGWTKSLFYNEPLIEQDLQNQVVAIGSEISWRVSATSRNPGAADNAVTYQWYRNGVLIPGVTSAAIRAASAGQSHAGEYRVVVSNAYGSTYSRVATLSVVPAMIAIGTQPRSQALAVGDGLDLAVAVSGGTRPVTYQWRLNGNPLPQATGNTYRAARVDSGSTGVYDVVISDGVNTLVSEPAIVTVGEPSQITNLSIRSNAGTGAETLIVGFNVGGAATHGTKQLLIRGTGPALAPFGVVGVLADPKLRLYANAAVLHENDNWLGNSDVARVGAQVGAFALTHPASLDAAFLSPALLPGTYSVHLSGADGNTGVALAEIYDATTGFSSTTPRLTNVSARTQVGEGAGILIAGFTITGNNPKIVLIRAVGPTLGDFGVAGVLADPFLQLYRSGTSSAIAANDNWEPTIRTIFSRVGAFNLPTGSKDAVLLVTLPPGGYTAQVGGVGGTQGVALVEVYEVL